MNTKLKVLITSNIPSPYFVNYCNELAQYVDLTVVFERNKAKNRDSSWSSDSKNFQSIYLKGIKTGEETALSFKIKKIIKKNRFDRIIIANPSTPTGIVTLLYLRRKKIPFIIQSEGGFQGSGKGIKEKFKKYLFEKAEFYLTGMGGDDDYFLMYGATKDKLKPYCFTSSYKKDIDNQITTLEEKEKLRKELDIQTDNMLLYVGQFIHRKGIDILLNCFKKFDENTTLVLIGGLPTKEYLDIIKENNLKNIIFKNFMSKDELAKYYKAANAFIMTTREDTWGLVINEAMEHGCPVITTTNCIAGRYLVKNDINGYLCDINNKKQITNAIEKILSDKKLQINMAKTNLESMQNKTIETMALTIFNYIK